MILKKEMTLKKEKTLKKQKKSVVIVDAHQEDELTPQK